MNNCEIVRDLIPLCVDDVASEASKELVKGHIETCAECKKVMDDVKGMLQIPVSAEQQLKNIEPLRRLKKSIERTIVKTAIIVGVVIAVILVGFRLMFAVTVPVHSPDVTFFVNDNQVMMKYNGPGDIQYSASGAWINDNGQEALDWTIRFSQTFWDRYIHPIYDHEPVVDHLMDSSNVKRIFDIDGTLLWVNPNP